MKSGFAVCRQKVGQKERGREERVRRGKGLDRTSYGKSAV